MERAVVSNDTLYRRVLGAAWLELHESVRQAHLGQLPSPYHGNFQFRHGESRLARALVQALRLPPAGEMAHTRLLIEEVGHRQRRRRWFDNLELVSVQQAGPGGLLLEKFGPLQFQFQLFVKGGTLSYQQTGLALALGPFRCNLPAWLSPTVSACEAPTDRADQIRAVVEGSLPGNLVLLRYEGTIVPAGTVS